MRILCVIPSMNPASGGPREALCKMAGIHAGLGHPTEVACVDAPAAEWLHEPSIEMIHALGPGGFGLRYSKRLVPWLMKNLPRFDAVIIHGLWQWPGVAVWLARRKLKGINCAVPPYYVFPHGMLDPYFQRATDRKLKAIRNRIYWALIEYRVVRDARALLFTCNEERLLAKNTFRPYEPQGELVTGLGTENPPPFRSEMATAFAEKCPALADRPYLLFLSRIHRKKGVDLLLGAYAKISGNLIAAGKPFPELVIAGPCAESGYLEGLQKLAATLGLQCLEGDAVAPARSEPFPRVHFLDMLSGDAKWGALYGCDAFVLPSHQENFGIAVAEALGCGRPVLISNQINIWPEIQSDGAGLVATDTREATAGMLREWLTLDAEARTAMGEAARRCYESRFQLKTAAVSLIEAITL